MIDIKDLIKWFIPCFHILLKIKIDIKLIFVCLLLFFNSARSSVVNSEVYSENSLNSTKNIVNNSVDYTKSIFNQSDYIPVNYRVEKLRTYGDNSVGRTFGRPFKKMIAGLLPVIFQIGAASTWAVVAALVGVKTLMVTLFILKLLLVAGAAKIGALFASKQHHHHQGWDPPHTPPQKEIHLHIHNGHPLEHHEEHVPISAWSRDGYTTQESKLGYIYEPYRGGPQTISTPYGNYVKIDSDLSTAT